MSVHSADITISPFSTHMLSPTAEITHANHPESLGATQDRRTKPGSGLPTWAVDPVGYYFCYSFLKLSTGLVKAALMD